MSITRHWLGFFLTGCVLELGYGKGAAITHLAHERLDLYGLNSAPQMLALVRYHEGHDTFSWHAGTIEQFENFCPF